MGRSELVGLVLLFLIVLAPFLLSLELFRLMRKYLPGRRVARWSAAVCTSLLLFSLAFWALLPRSERESALPAAPPNYPETTAPPESEGGSPPPQQRPQQNPGSPPPGQYPQQQANQAAAPQTHHHPKTAPPPKNRTTLYLSSRGRRRSPLRDSCYLTACLTPIQRSDNCL